MIINDLTLLKNLALRGMGIALMPSFFCRQELTSGKLVRVLPGWETASSPIHFVYPGQKFVSPKLNAFISVATEPLKQALATT
jgi:DNA-binding transcriptional LysR family regulator